MTGISDYKNRRIIIYDIDSKSVLADTVILAADKQHYVVTVSRVVFSTKIPTRVSVLIFLDQALHEYLGTVRKVELLTSSVDIALFKGNAKENRTVQRYEINRPATVEHLVIAKQLVAVPEPIDVMVVNLSTAGCLLRANTSLFNVNTAFQLTMDSSGTQIVLQAKVLRIQRIDAGTVEYGCCFQFEGK